jgi:hypothetical protein
MKDCNKCALAEWKRTDAGKLHPSGDGRCAWKFKLPPLPASMYFIGGPQTPAGGHISRRKELPDHCPQYRPI